MPEPNPRPIQPAGRYVAAGFLLGLAAGAVEGLLVNRAGIFFVPFAGLAYGVLVAAGFAILAMLARLLRRDLAALGLGAAVTLFAGLEAGFLLNVRANPFEQSGPALAGTLAVVAAALAAGVGVYLASRRRTVGRAATRAAGWLGLITVAALAGFFLVSWRAAAPGDNCILISVDAMRADHSSLYGYERETTPTLDALALNSTMWLRAYTQSPGTSGGHGAMLTGLYPLSNGAYLNGFPLDRKVETLAEVFSRNGYATAAFINNWYLSPALGFGQGFDCFVDGGKADILRDAPPEVFARGLVLYQVIHRGLVPPGAPSDAELVDALRWIAWRRNHRFFVLLHIMDPHSPYRAPADLLGRFAPGGEAPDPDYIQSLHDKSLAGPLTEEERAFLVDRYDEEILSADRKIGRVLEWLDREGLRGKTLVVVTADHGEVMGESVYKQFGHGTLDYGCLHVPLVVSYPGRVAEGHAVDIVTGSLNITPTIIDLMGLKDTARRQGYSLAGQSPGADVTVQEVAFTTGDLVAGDQYSVITADWQYLVMDDRVALYAAGDTTDLISLNPEAAAGLQALLEQWMTRCLAEAVVPYSLKDRSVRPGKEALERLRAVGYVH